jgi:amino-acid N-acetyltransferase
MNRTITIREAVIQDVPAIQDLIQPYVEEEILLPVSPYRLYERIRDFVVAEENGLIVGCGSLMIMWHDLAEIRSLAVRKGCQGGGIGRRIVEALMEEARQLGIARVFALTYETGFFVRLGFREVPRETLPHKVWKDCLRCSRFDHCNEIAVERVLIPEAQRPPAPLFPPMPPDPTLIMPSPAE